MLKFSLYFTVLVISGFIFNCKQRGSFENFLESAAMASEQKTGLEAVDFRLKTFCAADIHPGSTTLTCDGEDVNVQDEIGVYNTKSATERFSMIVGTLAKNMKDSNLALVGCNDLQPDASKAYARRWVCFFAVKD